MTRVKPKSSISLDRSSSYSDDYLTSKSRSFSEPRSSYQKFSKPTDSRPLTSRSFSNSLEVNYNGICEAPDYYSKILGPTADESMLVGLKMLVKLGFVLPDCTDLPPKYEQQPPESSSDTAAQTESSETKSTTSQTTAEMSLQLPIGDSKETYVLDYEESLPPVKPSPSSSYPASVSTESLNTPSPTMTSEERIPTEPSVMLEPSIILEQIPEPILEEIAPEKEESEQLTIAESKSVVDEEVVEEDEEKIEKEKSEVIEEEEEIQEETIENEKIEEKEEIKSEEKHIEEASLKKEESEVERAESSEATVSVEEQLQDPIIVETMTVHTEEELPPEDESTDDDILRLREALENAGLKSQDDLKTSLTSTFQLSAKISSVSKNRSHRSKFPEEILVATTTYSQDDQSALNNEEIRRLGSSLKPPHNSTKGSKQSIMSETDSKKSTENKEQSRSKRESKESSRSSRRDSKDSTTRKKAIEPEASNVSKRSSKYSKEKPRPDDAGSEGKPWSTERNERRGLKEGKESNSGSKKDRNPTEKDNKVSSERSLEHKRSERVESRDSKLSDKGRYKEEPIEEEADEVEETEISTLTGTPETASRTSSLFSEYDTSEVKSSVKTSKRPKEKPPASSTPSIAKSSISSKTKDSSTETFICTCNIIPGDEKQSGKKKCVCQYCYCPRCDGKKIPAVTVVPCPYLTAYMKTETPPKTPESVEAGTCPCANLVINDQINNQNQKNSRENGTGEDLKLLCDCYTSTSSTGYSSSSDSCGQLQRGDCGQPAKCNVRYAITKITEYGKFTTFEVMKSTKKVPKFMPKSLEGVFVLKHKS